SRWLAYTLTNRAGFQAIWLYAPAADESYPLTDGLAEAGEPVFDQGGKYLYFAASTDAGPAKNWFDQSFTDMPASASVYLVTLGKATPTPLLKESDEEAAGQPGKTPDSKDSQAKKAGDSEDAKGPEAKDKDKKGGKEPPAVTIDLEGVAGRVVALPIEA